MLKFEFERKCCVDTSLFQEMAFLQKSVMEFIFKKKQAWSIPPPTQSSLNHHLHSLMKTSSLLLCCKPCTGRCLCLESHVHCIPRLISVLSLRMREDLRTNTTHVLLVDVSSLQNPQAQLQKLKRNTWEQHSSSQWRETWGNTRGGENSTVLSINFISLCISFLCHRINSWINQGIGFQHSV